MEIEKVKQDEHLQNLKGIELLKILQLKSIERVKRTQSKNSNRVYKNAARAFNDFCDACEAAPSFAINDNEVFVQHQVKAQMLLAFIEYLTLIEKSVSTVKTYVAAISALHKRNEFASPLTAKVKNALAVLEKDTNTEQSQAEGISEAYLCDVVKSLDTDTNIGKRDKAIMLIGFLGALRRSELASLDRFDTGKNCKGFIKVKDSGITITLKQTKTQKTESLVKFIPCNKSNVDFCPVEAVRTWMGAAPDNERLFTSISPRKNKDTGIRKVGKRNLSGSSIDRIVKQHFGTDYSAHSFRVGFAIASFHAGASKESIIKHVGWKSELMFYHYTKNANAEKYTPVNSLNIMQGGALIAA